ncbi:hypothetical protein [Enterococcus songbeiensis]|uniref:hypothetical protein n=1 Tax=Enterococcus songbeiensis TaxID=2559927 RepID=UPI0010F95A46|nr:hypothetical protein [Enterococcus songbeiensis]
MDEQAAKKLVGKFNQEELIQLICTLVAQNEEAEEQLLSFCQKEKPNQNKLLILEQQLNNAWINAYNIIDEFNEYGGGSENDEYDAYLELDRLAELLQETNFSWKLRKKILDEIMEQVHIDNSGFTDNLVDVAVELCQTKEENLYLANCLVQYGNSYYKKAAAQLYKENGEKTKYLIVLQENLEYSSDYVELATFYQQEGKENEAIQLAWKGLDESLYNWTDLYKFLFSYYQEKNDEASLLKLYQFSLMKKRNIDVMTEQMYNYYKKKRETVKQKEMLIKLMFCTNDVKKWYERCQEELTTDELAQYEPQFIEVIKKKNPSYYLDICIERGQLATVLLKLQNPNSSYYSYSTIDEDHRYSKQLIKEYPQEILALYWQEVDYYAKKGKRKNYSYVVNLLEEIHETMKKLHLEKQWEVQYQKFVVVHKRKRLLMEMLEKFQLHDTTSLENQ